MKPASPRRRHPKKPYPTFPLTPHPNGQWCKKIRGRIRFFGVWADPDAALKNYTRQATDLHAGREPRVRRSDDVPTVKELANAYLNSKLTQHRSGSLSARWFDDCLVILKNFVSFTGKDRCWDDLTPADFGRYRQKLYERFGVYSIDRHITVIRGMFRFAFDSALIGQPVRYGQEFKKPSAKEKRLNRAKRDREHGKRLFSPDQILAMLERAQGQLKAMILLGINGGYGNTDCAQLPLTAVDLEKAIIDYERPKTGVQRIVPLWPETVEALREVIRGDRPEPALPEYAGFVFLTLFGNPWRKTAVNHDPTDDKLRPTRQEAVGAEFHKLLVKLTLQRRGVGFYSLRHTFRTWADQTKDQHAIHRIMGHAIPGMSGVYIEDITEDRLRAVTNFVRSKLFPTTAATSDSNDVIQ